MNNLENHERMNTDAGIDDLKAKAIQTFRKLKMFYDDFFAFLAVGVQSTG